MFYVKKYVFSLGKFNFRKYMQITKWDYYIIRSIGLRIENMEMYSF